MNREIENFPKPLLYQILHDYRNMMKNKFIGTFVAYFAWISLILFYENFYL